MKSQQGKIGRTIEIIQCLLEYIDSDTQDKWNVAFQNLLDRYKSFIDTNFLGI